MNSRQFIKQDTLRAFEMSDYDSVIRLNQALIYPATKKYIGLASAKGHTEDDLYAVGLEALWYTCKKWNPAKGAFSTLATLNIERFIYHWINARQNYLFAKSWHQAMDEVDLEYAVQNHITEQTVEDRYSVTEQLERLSSLIAKKYHNHDQVALAFKMYLDGENLTTIAGELDVSLATVQKWLAIVPNNTQDENVLVDIPGFISQYSINKKGQVWSYRQCKFLKIKPNFRGSNEVVFTVNGKSKKMTVNTLLKKTFGENHE